MQMFPFGPVKVASQHRTGFRPVPRPFVRSEDVSNAKTQELFPRIAEHFQAAGIRVQKMFVGGDDKNGVAGLFEKYAANMQLALMHTAQLLLRSFHFVDQEAKDPEAEDAKQPVEVRDFGFESWCLDKPLRNHQHRASSRQIECVKEP